MNSRVSILDGLRLVAISMVMFCHYFYHTISNELLKDFFYYGYMGVSMFFIISGFVIALSLERSKKYIEFLKKRYIRLAPGMLICSTITFVYFAYIYGGDQFGTSKDPYNYLIANTFIDPYFFGLFSADKLRFSYVDGSYWSLWVEVNFYVIIGFLYFLSPKNLIRNYLILCVIGIPIFVLFSSPMGHVVLGKFVSQENVLYMKRVSRVFVFFHECLWFLLGLYLYKLYKNKKDYKYVVYMLITLLALIVWQRDWYATFISIAIVLVYFIFIYKPEYLSLLANKYICKLGVASYSMYLIHFYLGVVFIEQIFEFLGKELYIVPILMMGVVYLFGLLSYKYLETPLANLLKRILLKSK